MLSLLGERGREVRMPMGGHLAVQILSHLVGLASRLKKDICYTKIPLAHVSIYKPAIQVTQDNSIVILMCCSLTFLTREIASWSGMI